MINSVEGMEVGQLFTNSQNEIWCLESFFSTPSLTIKNILTGEELNGGVGCLNFADFKRAEIKAIE